MTNWQEKTHNPDEDALLELLFGRKVTKVNPDQGTFTLDDGQVLMVGGNEGCGGCPAGNYDLTVLAAVDNAITNVKVTEEFEGSYGTYSIFVIAEDHNEQLFAEFQGSDGDGWNYGTGWWITVLKDPS